MSACDPSDIDAQIAALEKYKRTRFDILGKLEPKLAVLVMGNLDVNDILNLRLVRPFWWLSSHQVSRTHLARSQENELWKQLCLQRNTASVRQAQSDTSSPLQEGHWETEYRRLVRRDRNWRLGLVSLYVPRLTIQLISTGTISHSLPRSQGPCVGTQTSWDQSNKRVNRRHVSERHELRLMAVSGSGMYPYSLLRRPSSQPLFYPQARSRVSTTYLAKLSSLPGLAMSVESNYGARSKTTGNLGSPSPVILMASELSRESPF